jgi:hypothetical protein
MDLIPVEGNPGLYRDNLSNAIVNTNKNDYESYLNSKKKMDGEREKINSLEMEMNSVKNDISEIKNLLIQIAKNQSINN